MIYVVVQFSCVIYLLINAHFSQLSYALWGLLIMGWIIGYAAVAAMGLDNIAVQPQLKTGHRLVTHGVYRYVRHPMYTSLMIQGLALVFTNPIMLQYLAYGILLVVLFLKSSKEEFYLSQRFDDYAEYKNQSGRFLPALFR